MDPSVWSRRQFLATAGAIAAVTMAWRGSGNPRKGRLTVRPHSPTSSETTTGFGRLGQGNGKDGLVYVPAGYHPERPAPLMLSLHGARGGSRGAVAPLVALADQHGWILVAPDSRQRTWDAVLGEFGPDVEWIDEALEAIFRRYAIDPQLLAAEGFSDGGSYALSLGLVNGDLFTHVIAFSPGLVARRAPRQAPGVPLPRYCRPGAPDRLVWPADWPPAATPGLRSGVPRVRRRAYRAAGDRAAGGGLVQAGLGEGVSRGRVPARRPSPHTAGPRHRSGPRPTPAPSPSAQPPGARPRRHGRPSRSRGGPAGP